MAIETTSDLSLVGTSQIVDGSVTSAKIGTGAVGTAKINSTGVSDGYLLTADGSGGVAWEALAAAGADVQEFTSNGTWTKPAGKTAVFVFAIGAGGGGAAGARSSVGVAALGGNRGAGGAHAQRWMAASELAGTVTVTIGAGGAGGTAVAADTTTINGSSGVKGGDTSFGTHILALGAAPGFDSDSENVALPFTGTWEWGYNTANASTAGGTTDAGDAIGDIGIGASTFAIRHVGPALNFASSSASTVLNAVRAMTRSGHGAKGGLAAATAASSRGGGAGARGFGSNGSVPNGGGYAGSAVNATAAQAGSVCTVGVGHGGGGGGPAINATPSAGGAGYLGGGGGGGGGLQTSTSRANAAGGAGGGGYILVVSV